MDVEKSEDIIKDAVLVLGNVLHCHSCQTCKELVKMFFDAHEEVRPKAKVNDFKMSDQK